MLAFFSGIALCLAFGMSTFFMIRDVITDAPIISLPLGDIKGRVSHSRDGREFHEYLGIPYAKPPIGALRFEPPQPPEQWKGSVDARYYRAECAQYNIVTNTHQGEENCLFLNVHVPQELYNHEPRQFLPVIVYIHGGGFISGSANMYRVDYFMDEDVILVTFNYRLGAFGFLNTGDSVVRGNMGLKDQVMAFEWIQNNIQYFGGNPNQVTLFGSSAGAASVHLHMISPLSRGLFQRAICQSGTTWNPWALNLYPAWQARHYAEKMDCGMSPTEEMIGCMKRLPLERIVAAQRELREPLRSSKTNFGPTIEYFSSEESDEDAFLSEHPLLLHQRNGYSVPWIVGVTSEEGLLATAAAIRNQTWLTIIDTNFRVMAPTLYLEEHPELMADVRSHYFGENRIDSMVYFENFTQMYSDRLAFAPMHNSVTVPMPPDHTRPPTYIYIYSHPGEFTLSDYYFSLEGEVSVAVQLMWIMTNKWLHRTIFTPHGGNHYYGVNHADDIGIMFRIPWIASVAQSDPDYQISKAVVRLWVDFASGVEDLKLYEVQWTPLQDGGPLQYLNICQQPSMMEESFTPGVTYWNTLLNVSVTGQP